MNVQEKALMLKELRKQHLYLIEVYNKAHKDDIQGYSDLLILLEEKIEQILKTI